MEGEGHNTMSTQPLQTLLLYTQQTLGGSAGHLWNSQIGPRVLSYQELGCFRVQWTLDSSALTPSLLQWMNPALYRVQTVTWGREKLWGDTGAGGPGAHRPVLQNNTVAQLRTPPRGFPLEEHTCKWGQFNSTLLMSNPPALLRPELKNSHFPHQIATTELPAVLDSGDGN